MKYLPNFNDRGIMVDFLICLTYLAVNHPFLGPSFAVVDDNLVVVRGRDQAEAVPAEVYGVDLSVVLLERFSHAKVLHHLLVQLHDEVFNVFFKFKQKFKRVRIF